RRTGQELFELAGVGRVFRSEVESIQLAVAPVAQIERLPVLGRELRAIAERDARRRAGSNVGRRGQAVHRIRTPLAGAVAVAALRAAGDVKDAGGPIPGSVDVPLHVGVVGEELAIAIERDVERVAEADRDQLPSLAVRADAVDMATGCLLAGHEAAAIDHP